MDNIIKKQTFTFHPSTPSPALAVHKHSHNISKPKPKIRIIHIFAPEIIKTDAANFRELVQRLTGKPADHHQHRHRHRKNFKVKNPRTSTNDHQERDSRETKKMDHQVRGGFLKEQETLAWLNSDEASGGFLNGFGELDGFIRELGKFTYLPVDADDHHHHHPTNDGCFGEAHH